jgi:hypothetical protein
MNHIEAVQRVREGVGLVKFERVMGLRKMVNANHFEAGAMVANRTATGPAEEIQELWSFQFQ